MEITSRMLGLWSGVYLVAGGALSRLIVSPSASVIWGVLSIPSIVVVPFIVGLAVVQSVKKIRFRGLSEKMGVGLATWITWGFGFLVFASVIVALQLLGLFTVYLIPVLAIGSATLLCVGRDESIFKLANRTFLIFLCLAAISTIPVFIASLDRPFPLFGLDFDAPAYTIQPVTRAIQFGYFTLDAQLAEQILAIIGCFSFNVGADSFVWLARFLLEAVFCIGMYVFVVRTTKSSVFAFLAAIIAPFLMVGTNGIAGSDLYFDNIQQHFRSNTLILAVFPFLLSGFVSAPALRFASPMRTVKMSLPAVLFAVGLFLFSAFPGYSYGLPNGYNLLNIVPYAILISAGIILISIPYWCRRSHACLTVPLTATALVLYLMHSVEFVVFGAVLLIFLTFASWANSPRWSLWSRASPEILPKLLFPVAVILMISGYISNWIVTTYFTQLSFSVPFLFFYQGVNVLVYEVPKVSTFVYGNGPFVLALLVTGILLVNYRQTKLESLLLTMFALTLFLYFMPLGFTYRLFKEIIPFMAPLVALPLFVLVGLVLPLGHRTTLRYASVGFLVILVITGVAIPTLQRFTYHDFTMPQSNWQSYLSYSEIDASNFLESNTPPNSVIFSDPFTVYMLASTSDRIHFYDPSQFDVNGLPAAAYLTNDVFLLNQRANDTTVMKFNGVNAYAKMPLHNPAGPFSIDLWVERTGDVNFSLGFATISGWSVSNSEVLEGIVLYPGNVLGFRDYNGNATVLLPLSTTIQEGIWYNIAVTFENDTLCVYVNGRSIDSRSLVLSTLISDEFVIGASVWQNGQNRAFNGLITDVRIYDRVLSQTEVQSLYSSPYQRSNNSTVLINPSESAVSSNMTTNSASSSENLTLENGASLASARGPLQLYDENYLGRVTSETLAASADLIPYTELAFLSKASISNLTALIVISPRTLEWVESGGQDWLNFYPSNGNVSQSSFPQFQDTSRFTLLYDSGGILIYEMKQTVAVPPSLYSIETAVCPGLGIVCYL